MLVLSMFLVTMSFVPDVINLRPRNAVENGMPHGNDQSPQIDTNTNTPINNQIHNTIRNSIVSESSSSSGILDPVSVEQSGYSASDNISARTDSYENLDYALPLDTDHGWVADEAEVTVWNLERQYAVNGSFSTGIAGVNQKPNGTVDAYPLGWSANSTDGGGYSDDNQIASYDASGKFVTVESIGGKTGQQGFTHDGGTRIIWIQTIENVPYSENFLLSFDYFYARGPLDHNIAYPITNDFNITVFADDLPIWTMSLKDLSERGVWTSTGVIHIPIPSAPSSFQFQIGLDIPVDQYLDIRYDYDSDGIEDGLLNAAYVAAYLDDVSFIRETPPTAEQVGLEFTVGEVSSALSGSLGTYTTSITNSSYWTAEPITVSLTANTSISFDYKTRLFSHRFIDSNWRTDITSLGVSYKIEPGLSPELAFYAYVGYLGNYEEPQMTIVFPKDWENATVSDPFLTPRTASCDIGVGYITVPTSLIDSLGWWEFRLDSPNYAKSLVTQKYDPDTTDWSDETIFRIGNSTRTQVAIGTSTQTPTTIENVNITWSYPSGDQWTNESLSGGVAGLLNGSSHEFLSGASPAGVWTVAVEWINGTEVAYAITSFEVHHVALLVADPPLIETNAGETITGIVRYADEDTGAYLMDSTATLSANWSMSTLYLVPNPVNNWWQVQLDTSTIGAGSFKVQVNAVRPYYDAVSCYILIESVNVTRLNSPNAPWSSAKWGSIIPLTLNYESYFYPTSTWSPVTNNSDVEVAVDWPEGFWNVNEDIIPGIYLIDLDTTGNPSGTYLLNVTFSKPYHESKQIVLTLIISPMASYLHVQGEQSARVDIGDAYDVKLYYSDYLDNPITGASIIIDSINPPVGLEATPIEEVSGEPGNYSLSLTPNGPGVFTIRFVATELNAEPAITVFVLVVNDVKTSLQFYHESSVEIGLTDGFNTTFRYESNNGTGIEAAAIEIIYTGNPGMLSWVLEEGSLGNYSIEFSATMSGTYLITIAAFKQYYQSASNSFFLIVREITANFTILNGTADVTSFGNDYRLVVSYANGSGYGLSGADIIIDSVVPSSGLTWDAPVSDGPGLYSILLHPSTADTFTILLRASLINHQTLFARFTITATAISTNLVLLNASTSISLDQSYTVYLLYQSETSQGLAGAQLAFQNPPAGLSYSEFEDLTSGLYRITLTPLEVGTFDCIFRASLDGYQSDTTSFTLGATRIPTALKIANGLSSDSIMFSNQYELLVFYERTDSPQNISLATIDLQTSSTIGFSWSVEEVENAYRILIETTRIGRWTLTITAQKMNYAISSVQFILDVNPTPINVEFLSSLSVIEGAVFDITVRLTIQGTTIPITGADVYFRITTTGAGEFQSMYETDTDGVYSATYQIPLYLSTSEYLIEIRVEKDNYELTEGSFSRPFYKNDNLAVRMTPILTISGFSLVLIFGLVIGMRTYDTRKKRRNLAALQVKKRFDDVSNILGILVLHKKSGLPIYSKILRGGFEEAMVSAFITAITNFRSEFEMDQKHWDFNVIPISDIISTVPTRSLIVSFITVRPPSKYQETGMEAFGRAVGAMFDEQYAQVQSVMMADEHSHILENLFYDLLDGFLTERYRTSKDVSFSKEMKCLESTAHQLEGTEGFRLDDLAKGMATCGIEESYAYKMVMDAIEDSKLEVVNGNIPDGRISGPFMERRVIEDDEEEEY